jgi:transcriptional pleiotropic repressor
MRLIGLPYRQVLQRYVQLLLFQNKVHDDFNENDLVLGEYAATVIGMEILREKHSEVEKEARDKAAIRPSTNVPNLSPPPKIGKIVVRLSINNSLFSGGKTVNVNIQND